VLIAYLSLIYAKKENLYQLIWIKRRVFPIIIEKKFGIFDFYT